MSRRNRPLQAGLLALVLLSMAGRPGYAAEPAAAPATEAEAIRLALEQSQQLAILNMDVEISGYRLEAAGRLDSPEIRLGNDLPDSGSTADPQSYVSLRWRPPGFGESRLDRLGARLDLCRRTVESVRYRHRLINRTRKRYAEVILRDAQADLAEQRLEMEQERLAVIERMVEIGRRTIVYLTKARMWLAESRHQNARALDRRKAARRDLAELTGWPEEVELRSETIPTIEEELEGVLALAWEHRPEAELTEHQARLDDQRRKVARRRLLPRPTFGDVGYEYVGEGESRVRLRLGIELPLFHRSGSRLQAKDLAARRRMSELAAMREQIRDEIREAYEVYSDCRADWEDFHQYLAGMITETERVIQQARRHQILDADEVLELDLVLLDTRQILAEKRQRLAAALADLLFAMRVEEWPCKIR